MRLRILSDLHTEFGKVEVPPVDCDAVILAGDVGCKRAGLQWIRENLPDLPVFYVMGNHEYYGDKMPRLVEKLREEAVGTNVHILEDSFVSLGGFHFFGCTLWTDMALHGDWITGAAHAESVMNDYKKIRNSNRHYARLIPRDTRMIHQRSLYRLGQFLSEQDLQNCIVITHHAPSTLSLSEHRREQPISCAYASALDSFIEERPPRLWVHGHIHRNVDYHIGTCRVLSNPRAYPDELNPHFIPDLVVDVD